jgi:hypothetical protein
MAGHDHPIEWRGRKVKAWVPDSLAERTDPDRADRAPYRACRGGDAQG